MKIPLKNIFLDLKISISNMSPYYFHNLRASVIRAYCRICQFFIGVDVPIPLPLGVSDIKNWTVNSLYEIPFYYRGDQLYWNFKTKQWCSLDAMCYFNTLEDIDAFWSDYYEHLCQIFDNQQTLDF